MNSQNTEMSQKDALSLLINAVEIGQKRGVWKLEEAALLAKAISVFTNKQTNNKLSPIKEEEE